MVETTWATTAPPRLATLAALLASWLACDAASVDCRNAPVSCCIELAVCCRLLAVCSVRCDRSVLPDATSRDAVPMLSAEPRTSPTMPRSESCMADSAWSSCAASSLPSTRMRIVRSPPATACATRRA